MAASIVPNFTSNGIAVLCIILVSVGDQSKGLNLGLFAGDNKRHSNPLFIKKVSRLSPVFININSGLPRLAKPSLSLPIHPLKPHPLKLLEPKLPKLKSYPTHKLPRSLLPMILPPIPPKLPILPPFIPKLPVLPIIPLLLPPLLPRLPILPIPILPPSSPIPKLPKPIKVPILGKTPLKKALGSKSTAVVPLIHSAAFKVEKKVLDKLLELKRKGSITTAEFIRFKRLLLRK